MLNERVHEAINAQINAEMWSAYLYLAMSMDAEAKGYKGVANWFFIQYREELDHAHIFMNYLNSRDAKVELRSIEAAGDVSRHTCPRTESDSPYKRYRSTG